jgi:beta-barrel assembly-enhancing protease
MDSGMNEGAGQPRRRSMLSGRLLIALALAGIALCSYYSKRSVNPVTGETQHIDMSSEQEIALGLQAAPEMAQQHGGLSSNAQARALVEQVGRKLVGAAALDRKTDYRYQFHLLADPQTINAFALPGGQVFITEGLMRRLRTEGELAGVLGHEVGHVIERHGAEHISKQELTQGLTGAAVIATYDPNNPSTQQSAAVAMMIGNLINMKYGRDDELESDKWGVKLNSKAGYDPRGMLGVMEVLGQASRAQAPPEFMSTHPDPGNRAQRIEEFIAQEFPNGMPPNLTK